MQSPAHGEEKPGTSRGWVYPSRKWLCIKGSGDPERYQVDHEPAAAPRVSSILGCIRQNIFSRSRKVILFLYSALVRPQLGCWVQFRVSPYKTDTKTLKRDQQRANEMIKGLKFLTYEERLKDSCLFRLEKRRHRGFLSMCANNWR